MQGIGNDFVVVDACAGQPVPTPEQARRLADRHFGVGCDQVLVIAPPDGADADIRYLIFNADGSRAYQCGNGIRCVTRYLHDRGRLRDGRLVADTGDGRMTAQVLPGGAIRVDMGAPRLAPEAVPLLAKRQASGYEIAVRGERLTIGAVSMGNPHAVLRVADVDTAPVAELGPAIGRHPMFPQGANVGFAEPLDRHRLRLRVYERGAGETLACGSGACAAVVVGRLQGWLDEAVEVRLPGGSLQVEWQGEGMPVWMSGPAEYVFEGSIEL